MIRYSNIESGESQLQVADLARVETARLGEPKKPRGPHLNQFRTSLTRIETARSIERPRRPDRGDEAQAIEQGRGKARQGESYSRATPKKASDRKSVVITFEVLGH